MKIGGDEVAGCLGGLCFANPNPSIHEVIVNEPGRRSPFQAIQSIDYTVIFVRDMPAMRRFYEEVLCFPPARELSPGWIEYRIGVNTLALARRSLTAADAPVPAGSA